MGGPPGRTFGMQRSVLDPFLTSDGWIALVTLAAMEIVLGIDNIVFISIIAARVPRALQKNVRSAGLALALITRIGLLLTISWVMGLTEPLFTVANRAISGRDLILVGGGLFLVAKSTREVFEKLEVEQPDEHGPKSEVPKKVSVPLVLAQIAILDIVFSLDSVVTAVGMAKDIPIMVAAMFIAMLVMMVGAGAVGDFVNKHPSMTVLALSFLMLIGVMLIAEGFGEHVSKGYIYFAMAFSLGVELINMRMRKARAAPVQLHSPHEPKPSPAVAAAEVLTPVDNG